MLFQSTTAQACRKSTEPRPSPTISSSQLFALSLPHPLALVQPAEPHDCDTMAPTQVVAPLPSKRTIFYKPTAAQADVTQDSEFRRFVNKRYGLKLLDYWELHAWSVENVSSRSSSVI